MVCEYKHKEKPRPQSLDLEKPQKFLAFTTLLILYNRSSFFRAYRMKKSEELYQKCRCFTATAFSNYFLL